MLIFIHNAFRTISNPINFIFCSVYKVFCISVSVISKLLSTEMPTSGDLKPGDSLIFTNPTHPPPPPPNKLTQPPMGMQHSHKKLQPFFRLH